jgi:hypothetical protein
MSAQERVRVRSRNTEYGKCDGLAILGSEAREPSVMLMVPNPSIAISGRATFNYLPAHRDLADDPFERMTMLAPRSWSF